MNHKAVQRHPRHKTFLDLPLKVRARILRYVVVRKKPVSLYAIFYRTSCTSTFTGQFSTICDVCDEVAEQTRDLFYMENEFYVDLKTTQEATVTFPFDLQTLRLMRTLHIYIRYNPRVDSEEEFSSRIRRALPRQLGVKETLRELDMYICYQSDGYEKGFHNWIFDALKDAAPFRSITVFKHLPLASVGNADVHYIQQEFFTSVKDILRDHRLVADFRRFPDLPDELKYKILEQTDCVRKAQSGQVMHLKDDRHTSFHSPKCSYRRYPVHWLSFDPRALTLWYDNDCDCELRGLLSATRRLRQIITKAYYGSKNAQFMAEGNPWEVYCQLKTIPIEGLQAMRELNISAPFVSTLEELGDWRDLFQKIETKRQMINLENKRLEKLKIKFNFTYNGRKIVDAAGPAPAGTGIDVTVWADRCAKKASRVMDLPLTCTDIEFRKPQNLSPDFRDVSSLVVPVATRSSSAVELALTPEEEEMRRKYGHQRGDRHREVYKVGSILYRMSEPKGQR